MILAPDFVLRYQGGAIHCEDCNSPGDWMTGTNHGPCSTCNDRGTVPLTAQTFPC